MRPTIVFLPGLLCDASVFAAQIEALTPVADVKVADFSSATSITEMGEIALRASDGPLSLIGYSMGGRAALEAVRIAPQRVARLCLMDTGFAPPRETETAVRQALIDVGHKDGMAVLAAKWLPPMLHPDREADPALLAPLTEMVLRASPQQNERQLRALLSRPDARPVLGTIKCPTTVIVGRQDRWASLEQHQEMTAAIAGARLVIIEDSGHFVPVEQPEALSRALLDWLKT